ncbi:unnamed protein product [Ixodes pacificus]
MPISTLSGQACSVDGDCDNLANTFCKGLECICLPKFSRSYPPCNEGIELGESCSRHENCEVNDHNSYCHHSICRCKPSYHRVLLPEDNATHCLRGFEPKESCYNAEDCSGSNYTCSDGLCRCRDGFYKDDESEDCRPRKALDEACTRDSDCENMVNNSFCGGERCQCKSGYIRESYKRFPEVFNEDVGGRGALKILFALMLPVVVSAFVYLYRNRKVGQAAKDSADDDQPRSPAPDGTYSSEANAKLALLVTAPSMSTPMSPISADLFGSPSDNGAIALENWNRPHRPGSISFV